MPNDYTVACQSDTARWQSSCESSHAWRRSAGLCGLVWLDLDVLCCVVHVTVCVALILLACVVWLGVGVMGCACGGIHDARPRTSHPVGAAHALIRGTPGIHWLLYFCASLCEDWLTKWVVGPAGEADSGFGSRVM